MNCNRNTMFNSLAAWMAGPCAAMAFFLTCTLAWAADTTSPMKLTLTPCDQDRRFILAEHLVTADRLSPPYTLRDAATGRDVPCQWEATDRGTVVRWVVPSLPAGQIASFVLEHTNAAPKTVMTLSEDPAGFLAVRSPQRQITRYHFGDWARRFKKPFFYPLVVNGVAITRGAPMEKKSGESTDHPHHTSVYFGHGEVNGKDYWAALPIAHSRLLQRTSGPVYARLIAENRWGSELTEVQDVTIIDAGNDVIMDWVITLKAENGPVVLGRTKEGGFSVRVAEDLTDKQGGRMVDSEGNKGEPAIRAHGAPWADNYGTVDGKPVGVALMNHPKSWRYPTNWHVRGYGLFAANAFFVQGEHKLEKGESIALRYRLYAHGGDPVQAKVQQVYAGYAKADVKVE